MIFEALILIGTIVLGLAIAYGAFRSRQFRREATPADHAARDEATRENFEKVGDRPGETPPERVDDPPRY